MSYNPNWVPNAITELSEDASPELGADMEVPLVPSSGVTEPTGNSWLTRASL